MSKAPKNKPLVSIIIPCFNQGHFLADAICSALAQTYEPVEVIVVDDGSTDESSEVAGGFPEVRCIRQTNRGLATARNRGLHSSQGEYAIFLDSDDRLLPMAAAAGLDSLQSRPDCAMAFGRSLVIAADGSPQARPDHPIIESDHYEELLRHNYIWNPAMVIYRRAAIDRTGAFHPAISPSADYELYLRIARQMPICGHDHFVAERREHESNMSNDGERMLKATLTALRWQWPYVKGDARLEAVYREGMRNWKAFYGDHMINEVRAHIKTPHRLPQAMRVTLALLRYYPSGAARHAAHKLRLVISK